MDLWELINSIYGLMFFLMVAIIPIVVIIKLTKFGVRSIHRNILPRERR